jgi:hypothetical protein
MTIDSHEPHRSGGFLVEGAFDQLDALGSGADDAGEHVCALRGAADRRGEQLAARLRDEIADLKKKELRGMDAAGVK